MPRRIKLAIFDLDQTLINTIKRAYFVYNYARRKLGLNSINWEVFYARFKDDRLGEDIPKDLERTFWEIFRTKYCEIIADEDKPIDGAENVLKTLKDAGIKIIVTTGRRCTPQEVWKELKKFGLSEYIDDVYTAMGYDHKEDIPFERSTLLMAILEKYQISPDEAVFIADYFPDMYAGKKVGILTIGVKTGLKSERSLKEHGADYVIESICSLLDLLKEIGVL